MRRETKRSIAKKTVRLYDKLSGYIRANWEVYDKRMTYQLAFSWDGKIYFSKQNGTWGGSPTYDTIAVYPISMGFGKILNQIERTFYKAGYNKYVPCPWIRSPRSEEEVIKKYGALN